MGCRGPAIPGPAGSLKPAHPLIFSLCLPSPAHDSRVMSGGDLLGPWSHRGFPCHRPPGLTVKFQLSHRQSPAARLATVVGCITAPVLCIVDGDAAGLSPPGTWVSSSPTLRPTSGKRIHICSTSTTRYRRGWVQRAIVTAQRAVCLGMLCVLGVRVSWRGVCPGGAYVLVVRVSWRALS